MKNKISTLLLLLVGAISNLVAQQDSTVQNPCPKGMTLIAIIDGTPTTRDSVAGTQNTQYYKAWPWKDCKTGELFTRPRKRLVEKDSSYFFFTTTINTVLCQQVKDSFIEIDCEIQNDTIIRDTVDRTPVMKDSAYLASELHPQFGIRHSKLEVEIIGVGFSLTQFKATKIDSLLPRIQKPFQLTLAGEAALALYAEALGLEVNCTNCGGLVEKQKAKVKTSLNSRVSVVVDYRGKKTLVPNRKHNFEARGFGGLVYHCTELFDNKTQNRGIDGLEFIIGAGVIGINSEKLFKGPEVTLHFGVRPFNKFEGHTTLVIKGLFSGEKMFEKKQPEFVNPRLM